MFSFSDCSTVDSVQYSRSHNIAAFFLHLPHDDEVLIDATRPKTAWSTLDFDGLADWALTRVHRWVCKTGHAVLGLTFQSVTLHLEEGCCPEPRRQCPDHDSRALYVLPLFLTSLRSTDNTRF